MRLPDLERHLAAGYCRIAAYRRVLADDGLPWGEGTCFNCKRHVPDRYWHWLAGECPAIRAQQLRCPLCAFQTRDSPRLDAHLRRHDGERAEHAQRCAAVERRLQAERAAAAAGGAQPFSDGWDGDGTEEWALGWGDGEGGDWAFDDDEAAFDDDALDGWGE